MKKREESYEVRTVILSEAKDLAAGEEDPSLRSG
jgi:hypothetical protein